MTGTVHRPMELAVAADAAPGVSTSGTSLSGTITEGDLKTLVREFLEREGSDPSLVDRLFSGMVERVVAIVSRVQGLYEFDVQTLREYFAARHLYETAPYSPTGGERHGTISDRWGALSRNYYWLNVARFYAGCYSEGELSSLVDDLRTLSNDETFRCTSHPQLLTATLLGDWVFSQRPRATRDAVDLLVAPNNLRMLVARAGPGRHPFEALIVRDSVGRERLIAACKELVQPGRPSEQVMEVALSVFRPNSEPAELLNWWIEELHLAEKADVRHWCAIGEYLQCWSVVDRDTVSELLGREEIPSQSVIAGLLRSGRMDVIESAEELFDAAVEAVLAGEWVGRSASGSALQRLAWSIMATVPGIYHLPTPFSGRVSLREFVTRFPFYEGYDEDVTWPRYGSAERSARLVQAFMSAAKRSIGEWNTSTDPWDRVVQQGIVEFGERRVFVELANIAGGIRSTAEMCEDSPDLFDSGRPLVRRARYARLRAGSRNWWSKQLRSASSPDQVWMALLLFASWAGPRTFAALAEAFDKLIITLDPSEWSNLYTALSRVVNINSGRPWIRPLGVRVDALPASLSVRTASLLASRCIPAATDELYERYLAEYEGDDFNVRSLRVEFEVRRAIENEAKWPQLVDLVRENYRLGVPLKRISLRRGRRNITLPDAVAREIVAHPLDFPADLVWVAAECCRRLDASKVLPVGRVATDEGWFVD